jgi:FkbM family methyltransferase
MLRIVNEHGTLVDIQRIEVREQRLATKYIEPEDCVLELGARYGSVSCTINQILRNKSHQVVVEPDERVWDALETNRTTNACLFSIVKGFLSRTPQSLENLLKCNGYATSSVVDLSSSIPFCLLNEIQNHYSIPEFNVLIADCEGCLGRFLDEFPEILDSLRLFIFEKDSPSTCDYKRIQTWLVDKGFTPVENGFHSVWKKE